MKVRISEQDQEKLEAPPEAFCQAERRSYAGEDLSGQDFAGKDLSGIDFTEADLSGANFFKAKLAGAILRNAKLHRAEFTGADLSEANLENVAARQAGFGMACLKGANIFQADLSDSTLSKSDLEAANLSAACLKGVRMREAMLGGVKFTSADLSYCDLAMSNVARASFKNANLQNCSLRLLQGFEKADWTGVDVRDINFAGAYRVRRFILDQNYIKEFRESSRAANVLYYLWWISCDCGRSMLRWCLLIVFLSMIFAGLYSLVDIDYGDRVTWLSSLYYSVVTLTTLGYGDIVPASAAAQGIAMLEVVIGYMMLGGLLSIFSNKIARRAE